MKGLIYHEKFLFLNNMKLFIPILILSIIVPFLLIPFTKSISSITYSIYIDNSVDNMLKDCIKNSNLKIVENIEEANIKVIEENNLIKVFKASGSNQKYNETKDIFNIVFENYKESIIDKKLKEMNIDKEFFEPVKLIYEEENFEENNKSKAPKVFTSFYGILYCSIIMSICLLILFAFNYGFIEERKSKSIYSIVLSEINPIKKLLVIFFFRIFVFSFLLLLILTLSLGIMVGNFVMYMFINAFVLINLLLLFYSILILSMYMKNFKLMEYLTLIGVCGLPLLAWVFNKSNLLIFLPLTSSITVAKSLLFADINSTSIIISLIVSIIYFIVITLIGGKLFESEAILKTKMV